MFFVLDVFEGLVDQDFLVKQLLFLSMEDEMDECVVGYELSEDGAQVEDLFRVLQDYASVLQGKFEANRLQGFHHDAC